MPGPAGVAWAGACRYAVDRRRSADGLVERGQRLLLRLVHVAGMQPKQASASASTTFLGRTTGVIVIRCQISGFPGSGHRSRPSSSSHGQHSCHW
jgi:hypothetical protein